MPLSQLALSALGMPGIDSVGRYTLGAPVDRPAFSLDPAD